MTKHWYEQPISKDLAENVFQQLQSFTYEYILNHAPDLAITWPPANQLVGIGEYNPQGVVVHSTRSPSIWNTFRILLHNMFSTHFVVLSSAHIKQYAGHLDLIKDLPANVFMPHPIDFPIHHSGYISPITWGIDLRNTGILRPYDSLLTPPPLNMFEENSMNFRRTYKHNDQINMYWNYDSWREPFNGSSYNYEGYYYEKPSKAQIVSLISILRCIAAINSDFNTGMIIPANCIHGMQPEFPIIPWQIISSYIDPTTSIDLNNKNNDWLSLFHDAACVYEMRDIDDETWTNNQLRQMAWRGELENGALRYVCESEDELEFNNNLFTFGLSAEGYPMYSTNKLMQMSIRMYEAAHKITHYSRNDTLEHLFQTALIYNKA